MKKLSKMNNDFIENVYNNPMLWPKFIGLIQWVIGVAALIYCILTINDISILLMMLLFWVSFSFALCNYKKSSFSEGTIKTLVYLVLKNKNNLNENEKEDLKQLEEDKDLQYIMKDLENFQDLSYERFEIE